MLIIMKIERLDKKLNYYLRLRKDIVTYRKAHIVNITNGSSDPKYGSVYHVFMEKVRFFMRPDVLLYFTVFRLGLIITIQTV